jgi:hypothetical protein
MIALTSPETTDMQGIGAQRVAALLLWALAVNAAQACRPRVIDPVRWLQREGAGERIEAIYLGEVVGARNPSRLAALKRCRVTEPRPVNDADAMAPSCMEWFGHDFEVEIWPTEVLFGEVSYPSRPLIGSCLSQPPRLGTVAIVMVTSEGWGQLRVRQEDDPGFGWFFDDAWLKRLRACLADRKSCQDPAED